MTISCCLREDPGALLIPAEQVIALFFCAKELKLFSLAGGQVTRTPPVIHRWGKGKTQREDQTSPREHDHMVSWTHLPRL